LCCLIMTCFYRHTGWGRGWQHIVTTFLATKWSEIVVLESERGWDPRATNRLVTECGWSQILLSSPLRMLVLFQCSGYRGRHGDFSTPASLDSCHLWLVSVNANYFRSK
jgi:hypothetical protein